jgi:hypothetical protein
MSAVLVSARHADNSFAGRTYRGSVHASLSAVTFDARHPLPVARFWAEMLGRDVVEMSDAALLPGDATQVGLRFTRFQGVSVGPSCLHLHLTSSSDADQRRIVQVALDLGARHLDVGQRPEEGHVVLADPGDNAFCVIGPDSSFLAGCGFLGEVACDGSRDVGRFWSRALGWPLVWDQDEETAIQALEGGPKMAWGGPPLMPKPPRNRLHLDVVPAGDGDQQSEVARLESLGARRIDVGQGNVDWVVMSDPDRNEFCVLRPRP